MDYGLFLTTEYCTYIDKWKFIEINDEYIEYVVDFLRGFFSTIKSNQKYMTVNK